MLSLYYYRLFLLINSAILFAVYITFGLNIDITPYSYIYILMTNIYMLLQSRKNFLLFIVFFIVLFSNYSIIYSNFIMKFDDTLFTDVLSQKTTLVSLNILTLFNLFLFLLVKWDSISPNYDSNIFIMPENREIWCSNILIVLLIAIFFVGFKRPEEGQRGDPSPIYEYSLIFFFIFFYYSGNAKKYIIAGIILISMYSLQNFIFGGRILGIQFILCAYIMLLMHRMKMSIVISGIVAMFFLMSVVGVVRGELLSGNIDVNSILYSLVKSGFALDTAYSAYYTSESFVYILDKFLPQDILVFFWEFVKSIFVGGDPDMHLTSISSDYVVQYGGGVIPFYFYFYLGFIGILIAACLVALYMNIIISLGKTSSGLKKCMAVWVASTTFRWYLYSPIGLLRGVILLAIVYYSFAYLHFQLDRLPLRRNLQKESDNSPESAL